MQQLNQNFLFACVLAISLSSINVSLAQDDDRWTNSSGGFFDDGANWSDGSSPGIDDTAIFDLDANYVVRWDEITGNRTNSGLSIEDGDVTFFTAEGTEDSPFTYFITGQVSQTGGRFQLGDQVDESVNLEVGGAIGIDQGVFEVQTGSRVRSNGLTLGNDETTRLNVLNGGSFAFGSSETATLQRGAVYISGDGSRMTGGTLIHQGYSGPEPVGNSFFTIDGGGSLIVDNFVSGPRIRSASRITGAGSQLTANESVTIVGLPNFGEDNMLVTDGGRLQTQLLETDGLLSISDNGVVDVETLDVATRPFDDRFTGDISLRSGGRLTSTTANIATAFQSRGRVILENSTWENSGTMTLGGTTSDRATVDANNSIITAGTLRLEENSLLRLTDTEFNSFVIEANGGKLDFESGSINITADLDLDTDLFDNSQITLNDGASISVENQLRIGSEMSVSLSGTDNLTAGSLINNGAIFVEAGAVATLGTESRLDGYAGTGELNLNVDSVLTLDDRGLAQLGRKTELRNSTLNATNGVAIGLGATLEGYGAINGRIAASTGSAIYADGGDLTIGDASHVAGFSSQGELYLGDNLIHVLDANQAQLGSYTELGNLDGAGTLVIENGAIIDFGDNVVGYGTIENLNSLETAIINNGLMRGNSASERLIVEGYVKGIGTFDNVQFNGTFAPGLSPTITTGTNFFFGDSSVLEMEIGGLIPGDEHDAIWASELLSLDGTLEVLLINGFAPSLGDSFDLFNWGSIEGEFDSFVLPELATGLRWDTGDLYSTGVLTVSAVPEPSILAFSAFLGLGLSVRRRRNALASS